jgi:tetratricopeptide (TPR) repeat protein
MARARAHYEAGRALYSLGRYDDALREFMAGHQLAPRARFLLNMGQCYRKLGQPGKAKEMYTLYMRDPATRDAEERAQVEQLLAEATQAAAQPAAAPPSAPPVSVAVQAPEPRPAQEATPPRRRVAPHVWVLPMVSVVAAGVALGVGLGLGLDRGCATSGSLGCLDSRPHN